MQPTPPEPFAPPPPPPGSRGSATPWVIAIVALVVVAAVGLAVVVTDDDGSSTPASFTPDSSVPSGDDPGRAEVPEAPESPEATEAPLDPSDVGLLGADTPDNAVQTFLSAALAGACPVIVQVTTPRLWGAEASEDQLGTCEQNATVLEDAVRSVYADGPAEMVDDVTANVPTSGDHGATTFQLVLDESGIWQVDSTTGSELPGLP